MNFLCPSCKAKYHVADDKIAGRSLRMKCRKCEFVITLSDAPPAPPTLPPAEGELVPRLPAPPPMPQLGSGAAPRPVAQRRLVPAVLQAVRAPVAQAQGATAIAVSSSPPAEDELPSIAAEQWFVAIQGAPSGPMRLSELRERAGAGEITLESLVWRDGDDAWKKLSGVPELVAIVEEQLPRVQASAAPAKRAAEPPPLPVAPRSSERPAPSQRVDHAAEDLAAAGLGRRRLPVAAWAALVVAMLLGLTMGFVVFGGQKRAEHVAPVATAAPRDTQGTQIASSSVEEVPETAPAQASAAVPSAQPAAPGERPSAAGKPAQQSAKDPAARSEGPGAAAAPVATLNSATIEGTVARYKASVKRSCWQPALEARPSDAPTSARVNVTLTIAPSGSVQSVTTSGDPQGYPGLASCIAGRVRGWQFPPSGSSTSVNVPFVFAGQ
jgi:predicted Zn finger-like uncharacterized protein